jgi:hypothetical protein
VIGNQIIDVCCERLYFSCTDSDRYVHEEFAPQQNGGCVCAMTGRTSHLSLGLLLRGEDL